MRAGRRVRYGVTGFGLLVATGLAGGLAFGSGPSSQIPPCGYEGYNGYNGYHGYNGPCPTPTPTSTPQPTVSPTPTATATATPSPPVDRRPCRPAVRPVARQRVSTVRRSGLRLRFQTRELCRVTVRVYVDRRTARRLGIKRRPRGPVLVGSGTRTLPAGTRTLAVRLNAKTRRALRGVRRVSFSVRINTRDAAGNRATLAPRRVTVRQR